MIRVECLISRGNAFASGYFAANTGIIVGSNVVVDDDADEAHRDWEHVVHNSSRDG